MLTTHSRDLISYKVTDLNPLRLDESVPGKGKLSYIALKYLVAYLGYRCLLWVSVSQ
jgi:hypothetical protein